jgi:hypothetical protein
MEGLHLHPLPQEHLEPQAMDRGLRIVTRDGAIASYGVSLLEA